MWRQTLTTVKSTVDKCSSLSYAHTMKYTSSRFSCPFTKWQLVHGSPWWWQHRPALFKQIRHFLSIWLSFDPSLHFPRLSLCMHLLTAPHSPAHMYHITVKHVLKVPSPLGVLHMPTLLPLMCTASSLQMRYLTAALILSNGSVSHPCYKHSHKPISESLWEFLIKLYDLFRPHRPSLSIMVLWLWSDLAAKSPWTSANASEVQKMHLWVCHKAEVGTATFIFTRNSVGE